LKEREGPAAGLDGETWRHYGETLEENLPGPLRKRAEGEERRTGAKPVAVGCTSPSAERGAKTAWSHGSLEGTRSPSVAMVEVLNRHLPETEKSSSVSLTGPAQSEASIKGMDAALHRLADEKK